MKHWLHIIFAIWTSVCFQANAEQQNPTKSLYKSIKWSVMRLEARMYETGYDAREDLDLVSAVEYSKRALKAGGDPNYYENDGFKVIINGFLYTDLTLLGTAILIAGELQSTELVEAFLAKGANLHLATRNGWTPMDFALMNYDSAQLSSTTKLKAAIRLIEILESRGASLNEAQVAAEIMLLPSINGERRSVTLPAAAHQLQTLKTLMDLGMIPESKYSEAAMGRSEIRDYFKKAETIDISELKRLGAPLNDYSRELPADHYEFEADGKLSLSAIAGRHIHVMGAESQSAALAKVRDANPLLKTFSDGEILSDGTKVRLPLREDVDISLRNPPAITWSQVAEKLFQDKVFYRRDLSSEQILEELSVLNGFDKKDASITQREIGENSLVYIPYVKDRYNEFQARQAPATADPERKVSLFVIESKDLRGEHDHHTYRVASHVGRAINPNVDLTSFQSWNEILILYPYFLKLSQPLRGILNLNGSGLQDRVVFTHSMGTNNSSGQSEVYRDRRDPDNFDYNSIYSFQPIMEEAKPIIFHSAGNFNLSEGKFAPYYAIVHSPRTLMIGAAGLYQPGKPYVISPYSSQGGDLCSPLPKRRGRWMEGTSFSTPLTAGIYRQYSEWYGNKLTPEEIFAAAMWSANTDLREFYDIHGANNAALAGDMNKLAALETVPSVFGVNGGGLPTSVHCGAGLLDHVRWQETLDWMVMAKAHQTEVISTKVTAELNPDLSNPDQMKFVYEVKIDRNMMLGKLTFFVPQFKKRRSDIQVVMPSGYETKLIRSTTDVVSTYTFAYESVKAGDRIQLFSNRPLAPTSGVIVRGFAPGSIIEILRDMTLEKRHAIPFKKARKI